LRLACFCIHPLLEAILAQNNDYKWDESGLQLEALCYADDSGLLTEDPKDMQNNLDVVNEFCEATAYWFIITNFCLDLRGALSTRVQVFRLCFLWHASPVIYLDAKVFSSVSWCY
jgi:hypothetical protein